MAAGTKTRRTTGARQGPFGWTAGTPQGRFARSASTPRRSNPTQGLRRRRPPEPSGVKKVIGAMIPTSAAKKAAPSSKKGKAGALALVAGAAGMAFKNRDKLSELRRKDVDADATATSAGNGSTTNLSGPVAP